MSLDRTRTLSGPHDCTCRVSPSPRQTTASSRTSNTSTPFRAPSGALLIAVVKPHQVAPSATGISTPSGRYTGISPSGPSRRKATVDSRAVADPARRPPPRCRYQSVTNACLVGRNGHWLRCAAYQRYVSTHLEEVLDASVHEQGCCAGGRRLPEHRVVRDERQATHLAAHSGAGAGRHGTAHLPSPCGCACPGRPTHEGRRSCRTVRRDG